MAHRWGGLALLAAALAAGPAGSARADASIDEAIDEMDRLVEELQALLGELPRYGLPHITEDGDIVIPRRAAPTAAPEEEILEL
jgi:hypothetical protein